MGVAPKSRSRKSLLDVVVFALLLGLLLPSLLGGWVLLDFRERILRQELAEDGKLHATSLAGTLSEPVWNVDKETAQKVTASFLENPQIDRIVVSDLSLGDFLVSERTNHGTGKPARFEAEIRHEGAQIGRVMVDLNENNIDKSLKNDRRVFLAVVLAQLVLSFLVVFVLIRRNLLQPLRGLQEDAARLANGDLETPVLASGVSEVAELADGFEIMRNKLGAAFSRQQLLLDNVPVGVLLLDRPAQGKPSIVQINRRGESLLNYPPDALLGRPADELFPTDADYQAFALQADRQLLAGLPFSADIQLRRADGSMIWANVSGCRAEQHVPGSGSLWVIADITDRRKADEQLRLAARVFESTADGVMITDATQRIIAINKSFERITGYSAEEVIGRRPTLLRSGHQEATFYADMQQQLRASGQWQGEIWNRRKNQEIYPGWLTIGAIYDEKGTLTNYVGVFSDIGPLKQTQEQLSFLAHHDPLTGLANRLLVMDRLEQALARGARENELVGVMFVDLDHFKDVNDTHGHHAGDVLLQQIAGAVRPLLRESDTLGRLGGDEFLIILENFESTAILAQIADRILDVLRHPFKVENAEVVVTASIGIAVAPDDAADSDLLVSYADGAMYEAKRAGRNMVRFYRHEQSQMAIERLRILSLLRKAVEREELVLYLQPQVVIGDRSLIGAEALVRWQSAELGFVSPDRFIPLAEESGMIHEIGTWVIREACRQWKAMAAAGLKLDKLAVNVSAKQLDSENFVSLVSDILEQEGVNSENLQLEVTESSLMQSAAGLDRLAELRARGFKLAIDDFGTGYSSLSSLRQMPVQTLKIDRSFVSDIGTDADDAAIVATIIQMSKSLGLDLVAEGVETAEHAEFLYRHGCAIAQGYYYSRPVPLESFIAQWKTQPETPAG